MSEENEKVVNVVDDSVDLIAKAEAVAKRLEDANKATADLLGRQEALRVERTLGGESLASLPEKSEDEKARAEARKFLAGTGFEDELFPEK